MDQAGPPATLPLRPLTVGELLDAAATLLRAHGRVLLPVAAALAVAEQALLVPLREPIDPFSGFPSAAQWGAFWLTVCVGAGTEVSIVALLGGLTARAAGAAVLGGRLPARRLLAVSGGRFGVVVVIAVAAGTIVSVATLAGPLWAVGYSLIGLAVPAAVLDGVGPLRALRRGAGLACRSGLRAAWVRLLGYLAWFTVRIALAGAGLAALQQVGLRLPGWAGAGLDGWLLTAAVWVAVNAVAYPSLACLDAVLHLEVRTRTEGLDILLSRARRHGRLTTALLQARP